MGALVGLVLMAIVLSLLYNASQESAKRARLERSLAYESLKHVPAFLRERTHQGPWLWMDDDYRENYVDIKCTSCERDAIFTCKDRASGDSEFIDVHCNEGKLKIMRGNQVLFNGSPLQIMSYPQEMYEPGREK